MGPRSSSGAGILSLWLALALGGFLAAAFGYLLGVPALRLGPLYVSMVTFGFGLVVVIILQNWYELANGPNGMAVTPPELFGYEFFPRQFHVPIVLIAAGLFLLARNIVDSRHGRAFIAIRENELAARAMGINTPIKRPSRSPSRGFAGASGGLLAGLSRVRQSRCVRVSKYPIFSCRHGNYWGASARWRGELSAG